MTNNNDERIVTAFSEMQIWYHKHIIHLMIFFILTGLPLFSENFRWIAYIFGYPVSWFTDAALKSEILATGIQACRVIHRVTALIFALVTIPFAIHMLKGIKGWHIWPNSLNPMDLGKGINALADSYLRFRRTKDVGKYNLGQKAVAWLFIIGIAAMVWSGVVMMFRGSFSPEMWYIARMVHDVFFVLIGVALIAHMYFGMHPLNRCGNRAIFRTGETTLGHIKEKHWLWYERLRKEGKVD
ncbi:cytochrome b/b6 domain-containing protein [Limisalsivibrio acetivorans]|uniref:cytochrome b/b6 domain-containing protein n=1 Tax=Limisalsivibrio acetivorans TaxID=1304888 RepID=UPI0003B773D6|nr:cytochrome b/b6 domain-containing protein [Limisalsivibrio acetivorans]